jgi:hypothetical protein
MNICAVEFLSLKGCPIEVDTPLKVLCMAFVAE